MNVMTVDGYHAKIEYDEELDLEVCNEKGIEPRKHFSGKFNLRIPPELHEKLAIAAQAEGKSINMLAQEALRIRVAS